MNLYRWFAVVALTGFTGPAFGQYCSPSDPNYNYCTQQEQWKKDEEDKKAREQADEYTRQREAEVEEERRRGAPQRAEQARQQAEMDATLKALRAKLLASPPLPPDRNPLLGRWRVASSVMQSGGDDLSLLMGMLSNPGGAMCEVLFGGGTTEFKPGSWSSIDGAGADSLGSIQYRMQDKQVFALPDQGPLPLLGFDIVDKNTLREFRMPDCELVRVGAQPAAAPAKQAAQPAAAAAPPIAAARPARKPIDPNSPLGRGVRLHGEMEFQPALQQLLIAAKSDPNDPRVYVYLADTYNWLGMNAEAIQAAERAKQLDPNAFEILH